MPLAKIVGLETCCSLGSTLVECRANLQRSAAPFQPLIQHPAGFPLAESHHAAWIRDRTPLVGRRYGLATNAALWVTGNLIKQLNWTPAELESAWIFAASSRGNQAEYENRERRGFSLLAASNTLHSEIAAAVSIEHGIRGPWQMLSNGCASSLDALGMAGVAIASGAAPRALVVTAEMPLTPAVVQAFAKSGVLSTNSNLAPYDIHTDGMILGEGAAVMALEPSSGKDSSLHLQSYQAGSDAWDAVALAPPEKSALSGLLAALKSKNGPPTLFCPHATGTQECRKLEQTLMERLELVPDGCQLLKPSLGHTLGASGLLELALLANTLLPGQSLWKWASSMGGHHAVVSIGSPAYFPSTGNNHSGGLGSSPVPK